MAHTTLLVFKSNFKTGSTRGPSQMAKKTGQPRTTSLDSIKQGNRLSK